MLATIVGALLPAAVLAVSERTMQRRLNRGQVLLAEQLADLRPAPQGRALEQPGDAPPS